MPDFYSDGSFIAEMLMFQLERNRMATFKIGDKVKVIKSPYEAVRKGTITTIADIKNERYGQRWIVYILDTAYGGAFHEWELEKINDKEE